MPRKKIKIERIFSLISFGSRIRGCLYPVSAESQGWWDWAHTAHMNSLICSTTERFIHKATPDSSSAFAVSPIYDSGTITLVNFFDCSMSKDSGRQGMVRLVFSVTVHWCSIHKLLEDPCNHKTQFSNKTATYNFLFPKWRIGRVKMKVNLNPNPVQTDFF